MAPLAAPVTYWLMIIPFGESPVDGTLLLASAGGFLLWGSPVAYAVAFAAGWPILRYLDRRGRLTVSEVLLGASFIGLGASLFLYGDYWPLVLAGPVAGLVSATAFWIIGLRSEAPALVRTWRGSGVQLCEGASPATIRTFEKRHTLSLPFSLKTLLLATNGTATPDRTMFSLWSLERFEVSNQGDGPLRVAFGDDMIGSSVYEMRYENRNDPIVVLGQEPDDIEVARSFDGFAATRMSRENVL